MELLTESYDWTRPTEKNYSHKNYTYDEFIIQIEKQIDKKIHKIKPKIWDEKYFLQEIKITLDEHVFNNIITKLNKQKQKLYPLVTFHSTQNMTKINSIIKYGYIIPGTKHPTLGWTNQIYYGNIFGDGIYSSPEFEKSQSYTFIDSNHSIQVLINLVVLGKTKIVCPYKWYPDNYDHSNNKSNKNTNLKLDNVIPSLSDNLYVDLDGEEYDTLISVEQDVIVSSNSENIIPVGYLILSPNAKIENNKNPTKRYLSISIAKNLSPKPLFDLDNFFSNISMTTKSIDFVNIFNDYYIIDIKNIKKKQDMIINNYIIIPSFTVVNNKKLSEQFENFIDSIGSHMLENKNQITKQNKILYLNCSNYKKKINLNNKEKFTSIINESTNKLQLDYEYLSNLLVEIFEQIIKSDNNELSIIYLFVNNPKDIDEINKIVIEYKIFKKVIVKIIFLKKLDDTKTKSIINIKNTFQNIDFYEQYFHEVNLLQNESLTNTFDILLDEYSNIPVISYTKLSIPYGLAIIGDGFVDTLHLQPNWDSDTLNSYVLFKGYVNLIKIDDNYYKPKYVKKDKDFFESLKKLRDKVIGENEELEKSLLKKIQVDPRLYEQTIKYSNNFIGIKKDILDKDVDLEVENLYCVEKNTKPELEFETTKEEIAWKKKFYRYKDLKTKLEQGFIKNDYLENYCEDYEDINKLYSIIIPLMAKFRNWVFTYPKRAKTHTYKVSKLLNEILERLDKFLEPEIIEFIRDVGYDQVALSNRKTIKYELNRLVGDITMWGKLTWNSKYLTKLLNLKYSKSIIKRIKNELDINKIIELIEPNKIYGKKISDPMDLFEYFNNIQGLGIRIKNSSSSEVEPWNIIVEYVGIEKNHMYKMVVANEQDNIIFDSKNKKINGLILDNKLAIDQNNVITMTNKYKPVHSIYYSYILTSSPYLIIPNQEIALITNAWVSSVEKIFKLVIKKNILSSKSNQPVNYNLDNFKKMFEISVDLYERMRYMSNKNKEILEIKNNLLNKTYSLEYIVSTKNNITSLNKIFACLSLFDTNNNIPENLGVVLLSESSIRNARVRCKILKKSNDQVILDFLGLDENTNLETWNLNKNTIEGLIKNSNKLFFKQYTNCSPFSIVACLGFISNYNDYRLNNNNLNTINKNSMINYLSEQFIQNKISMYNFLVNNLNTSKTKQTQIALYLYGFKWSNLDKPDTITFNDPLEIKTAIINEYIQLIREKQEFIKKKKLFTESKLLAKQLILTEKAKPFRKYHQSLPTIFGIREIDELNVFRDKDDQLELLDNGLLKYHCAYPNCPYYLKKFMTLTDIKTQGTKFYTRHGLMNHFKYDQFNNMYVKKFHTIAKCLAKNTSWIEFVKKMDSYYENDVDYKNLDNKIKDLNEVFEIYKSK
jgi:hypothetical protein